MKTTFRIIERKSMTRIVGGGLGTSPITHGSISSAGTGKGTRIFSKPSFSLINILQNTQTSP